MGEANTEVVDYLGPIKTSRKGFLFVCIGKYNIHWKQDQILEGPIIYYC